MSRILSAAVALAILCSCATFEKNSNAAMGAMDLAVTLAKAAWDKYVSSGNAIPDQVARKAVT